MSETLTAQRVQQWLRQTARARASRVTEVPGGIAVRHDRFPGSHDHNRLLLWDDVPADLVARTAVEQLGTDAHRLVEVQGEALAPSLGEGMRRNGYTVSHELVLVLRDPPPRLPHVLVEHLDIDERAVVGAADWHEEQPLWPDELCRELGDRVRTLAGAVDATFLGVRGPDGDVVARADLFARDGVAQVEEVMTRDAVRGRGYASALIAAAVAIGQAHADLVFLVADADDWPQNLYRRKGFVDQQKLTSFRAAPA